MLRGVLFDLGSTLQEFRHEDWSLLTSQMNEDLYSYIDSRGYAHRLPPLDEFLEMANMRVTARWDQARDTMQGPSMVSLLQDMLEEHGIEDMRADECLQPWYNRNLDHIYIEPDVKPTLELLQKSGLKLGMVSNTGWPAAAHDPDLERFQIKDLLDCRLYSCEVGWEKPAPQIFEAALNCMGLQPEETAFVGDFLRYDVAGAHTAGMKGIWKQVEGRPEEVDDHTVVPDATITRISELPQALQLLYNWQYNRS